MLSTLKHFRIIEKLIHSNGIANEFDDWLMRVSQSWCRE